VQKGGGTVAPDGECAHRARRLSCRQRSGAWYRAPGVGSQMTAPPLPSGCLEVHLVIAAVDCRHSRTVRREQTPQPRASIAILPFGPQGAPLRSSRITVRETGRCDLVHSRGQDEGQPDRHAYARGGNARPSARTLLATASPTLRSPLPSQARAIAPPTAWRRRFQSRCSGSITPPASR
jgi:hypothetical protein